MYGDFSRGHEPDRARGRRYRRVLLQQGRPVLDSDVAARVDALLAETRSAVRALGCAAGSSDLGFLVTPGRLVTIFAHVRRGLEVVAGSPDVWVDHRHRYLDRYPALHVRAASGPVRVQVPATRPLVAGAGDRLTLWARVEAATTVTVNGVAVPLAPDGGGGAAPFTFDASGGTFGPVEIGLTSGEAWLFLLEQHQPAGSLGAFGVAPGSFQLDGLVLHTDGGEFPESTFPADAGFSWDASPVQVPLPGLTWPPAAGDRVVAYLEAWERAITAVEDPGVREVALGPTETSVRTELVAQVKLAELAAGVAVPGQVGQVLRAFGAVEVSGGELDLTVPQGSGTPDPCALPEADGYTGEDNRLYRIEVHEGGSLAQVRLKWSRDNASELFPVTLGSTGDLVLDGATSLAAGDLVEVLSDVVDVGDEAHALVMPGSFLPAQRAVGQLGQLVEVPSQAGDDTVRFRLADVRDSSVSVALDDRYGDLTSAGLKLRRWHGVLDPQDLAGANPPTGGPHVLEDGVTVTLSSTGAFRPGQYWQYEARAGGASGETWRPGPHGPKRWFAPLALLQLPESSPPGTSEDGPWELVAWLDERFDHLCELDADDIDYDGQRVGTGSDTVQEALDELYERIPAPETLPTVAADGINWRNDRPLPLATFEQGLQVTFSEEMHPATATTSAFVVSLELPRADNPRLTVPTIVDGTVGELGRTWTFVPRGVDADTVEEWIGALGGRLRCRVRLLSDVIVDLGGTRPLDGNAMALVRHEGYDTFVDLKLPSGDGNAAGDFHSWFFLEGPAPLVRVEGVEPGPGVRLGLSLVPRVVMISFSEPVRFDTLSDDTVQVLVRAQNQPDRRPVPGTIQPYPFEVAPRLVSRVTFKPDDEAAFGGGRARFRIDRIYSVVVKGTGVRDSQGRAVDAAGTGAASDFTSEFTVGPDLP